MDDLGNVDLELSIGGDDVEFLDVDVDTAISIIDAAIESKFGDEVIVAHIDKHDYVVPTSDDE